MKEDELLRELNEMVTDGEIKANKALDQAKDDLYHAQKEIENSKNQNSKLRKNIKDDIKKQVTEKYDKETISLKKDIKEKSHCFQFFCSIANLWGLVYKFHSVLDYADFLCNFQCIGNLFMQHSN